jgi:hypothetical protein
MQRVVCYPMLDDARRSRRVMRGLRRQDPCPGASPKRCGTRSLRIRCIFSGFRPISESIPERRTWEAAGKWWIVR